MINAIALYNEGIRDNFLFSNFMELRPYIDRIASYLVSNADRRGVPIDQISQSVGEMVDSFDIGWRNRFHGGWRLAEVSDFNLEFKGGIQQLVSALHAAYRCLSRLFSPDTNVLAVVSGEPGISVLSGAVRLNLFDIFKPEFFAARIAHEASERLVEFAAASRTATVRFLPSVGEQDVSTFLSLTKATNGNGESEWSTEFCRFRILLKKALTKRERDQVEESNMDWPGYLDQVYADICNFNWVFLGDRELYCFWALASYTVDPVNWSAVHRPDPACMRDFLVRTLITITDPTGSDSPSPDKLRDAASTLAKYWVDLDGSGAAVKEAYDISCKLLENRSFRTWLKAAAAVAGKGLLAQARSGIGREGLAGPWRTATREMFGALASMINFRDYVGEMAKRAENQIAAGRAVRTTTPWWEGRMSTRVANTLWWVDFCQTVSVLHGYLSLVKNRVLRGPKSLRLVLPRDRKTGQVRLPERGRDRYANVLFDPRGGSFAIDADFRRQYFMWRCATIMSLWDIGEKAKLREFRELPRPRDITTRRR